jgi:tetratricopeptide (TPR) repeat protein
MKPPVPPEQGALGKVMLEKVLHLERQILELKSEFPPESKAKRRYRRAKGVVDGVLSYWVPLALIVGLIVNWWFGVGFFENIKNIGINKRSSDYYYRIGDKLMSHAEFKAAGEAFAKSLEINPNNIDGTHGLMKAQVFQNLGDSQNFNPIVVDDKLAYLRNIFGKNDYILLYWEGILRRQQSGDPTDLKIPESLFERSIKQNADFVGSHLELGKTYMLGGEIDKAREKFARVESLDRRFTEALNYLGYCQSVFASFETTTEAKKKSLETAITYLERARKSGRRPETDLLLGDAYLYRSQFESAKIAHENALATLEDLEINNKNYNPFEFLLVYLPESEKEERDRGPAITVSTPAELKTLVLYSLSLDHASLGDFKTAEQYFTEGAALDPRKLLSRLVANKIYFLQRTYGLHSNFKSWLGGRIDKLCKGLEGCKPAGTQTSKG